jgi:hypothetical protein
MVRVVRRGWSDIEMPVARYFFFVGAALLVLLFISDAFLPKLPVVDKVATAADLPVIRIQSDRKWPEPIVFDTRVPAFAPAQIVKAEAVAPIPHPPPVADVSAKVRVREAFAQLQPSDLKKPEPAPKPRKRKIAKRHVAPPTVLVAQRPQFGFFANNTW